jgi:hypothetical protein
MNRTVDRKQIALEILEQADKIGLPQEATKAESLDRIAVYADLIRAGYLSGAATRDRFHRYNNVLGARITPSGREYLERLRAAKPGRENKGSLRRWVSAVMIALLGHD